LALSGRLDALPVVRLHPLVRDTSRPAPGPDLLTFTELAARLLKAAAEAAGETCDPRGPADVVGLAASGPARCCSAEQPQRSAGELNGTGALSVADLALTRHRHPIPYVVLRDAVSPSYGSPTQGCRVVARPGPPGESWATVSSRVSRQRPASSQKVVDPATAPALRHQGSAARAPTSEPPRADL
jgi:hypothetical protein